MSEIGTASSGIALTPVKTEKSSVSTKSDGQGVDRFSPPTQAEQSAGQAAAAQSEKKTDLSLNALNKKDPLAKAAEALEAFIPNISNNLPNTKLRINLDDGTGRFVYQNVDNESGEVVRQFPAEELLKFLAFYKELRGVVVDDEV